jgi:hypothetical protein
MLRKTFVTLALLTALQPATASRVVEQIERGVELTLNQLSLPSADGGTVSFRECTDCPIKTHVLMADAIFTTNGQIVGLPDLLRFAEDIEDRPSAAERTMAVVFLDIATNRVTRIEVRE